MKDIRIATAQFENRSGDKQYNLSVIDRLSADAAAAGATVIAFHECSITGYTFARNLDKDQMLDLAEPVPAVKASRRFSRSLKKIRSPSWQGCSKKIALPCALNSMA